MIDQETRKAAMFEAGKAAALALQEKSSTMTGTQLNDSTGDIPDFQAAKAAKNMLERTAGKENGFVCKSSAGRVVRLIQAYDSDTYPQEPEGLPAQWGFAWSQDPAHALPFISLATSPYMAGDVCLENGTVYRSTHDDNVWAPSQYPDWWEIATDDWQPVTPSPEPEPEEPETTKYPEWVQPTGSHDAYSVGNIVSHNGKNWQSTVDGNVWEPGVFGWEELV